MSNELLDMTVRKNFDLLTIRDAYGVTAQEQAELRANCQKVVTTFRKTVFNLCVMGAQLEAIKRSGTWKYVSDDKHSTFQYRKFSDFVNYVFGFSETRTSNLMSLAKYVIEDDGEYAFINPRYQDFNESQLIEMSTLETWEKQKIQSNMTVTDIRLCKKYMKSAQYVADKLFPNFDLLTCARSWEEKEEAKKQAKADTAPDVLPGQMGVEEIVPDQISEMASDGDEVQDEVQDEVLTDEYRERLIEACLIDSISKEARGEIIEAYKKGNLTCHAFAEFVRKKYGNSKFETHGVIAYYDEKGYRISYKSTDIFLTWTTAVGYIVSYINIGEYLDGFFTDPNTRYEEEYKPNGGVAFAYCDLSAEDFDDPMGEESADEYDERTAAYAPDEYDEEDEAYEDMQGDMQTIEEESERNIVFAEPDVPLPPIDVLAEEEESPKYDFSSRAGVRAWLKDWENWELFTGFIGCFFSEIRGFRLKNGTKVWATFQRSAEAIDKVTGAISLTYTVRYFFQTSDCENAFEVTKEQIECYIAAHKDEL